MTNEKVVNRITGFFDKSFVGKTSDLSIFLIDDGTYEVFGKYYIKKSNDSYFITGKFNFFEISFSSLKYAITWCIFDKQNKIDKTKRIALLDKMISSCDLAINVHKKLLKTSDELEYTLIHAAKLSEEKRKKYLMLQEMQDYMEESKRWQIQKFAIKDK